MRRDHDVLPCLGWFNVKGIAIVTKLTISSESLDLLTKVGRKDARFDAVLRKSTDHASVFGERQALRQ